MEDVIKRLLRLNLEIDGNLRSLLARPNDEVLDLLYEKVDDFNAALATLKADKPTEEPVEEIVTVDDIQAEPEIVSEPEPEMVAEPEPVPESEPEQEVEPEPEPEPEPTPEPIPDAVEISDETEEIEEVKEDTPELADDLISIDVSEVASEPAEEPVSTPEEHSEEPEIAEEESTEEPASAEEESTEEPVIAQKEQTEKPVQTPKTVNADLLKADGEYRVEDMIASKKNVDLAKSFTINDKYRFVRGLFCDDRNDFEYTIAQISSLDSLGEVYNFLLNDQGWDIDNDEVKDFITIITKYFNTYK